VEFVTLKSASSDSDAVPSTVVTVPLSQTRETLTVAELPSEKSLFTSNVLNGWL
jgi:hypothetical protein